MMLIEIHLSVPLYCAQCKRTSHRYWVGFDLEKDGVYHMRCLCCDTDLFLVYIYTRTIQVRDMQGRAVGFNSK